MIDLNQALSEVTKGIGEGSEKQTGANIIIYGVPRAYKFCKNKYKSWRNGNRESEKEIEKNKLTDSYDLISPQGIDYSELDNLLKEAQKTNNPELWKEANHQTYLLMLKAVGQTEEGWIAHRYMHRFNEYDLKNINNLWKKYSNNHFGFSVQASTWNSVYQNNFSILPWKFPWKKFVDKIGWSNADCTLKTIDELNFSINAPQGHLPFLLEVNGKLNKHRKFWVFRFSRRYWLFQELSKRLHECNIY